VCAQSPGPGPARVPRPPLSRLLNLEMSNYVAVDNQPVDDALLAESVELESQTQPAHVATSFPTREQGSSIALKWVVAAFVAILLLTVVTSSPSSTKLSDKLPSDKLPSDKKVVPRDRIPVDLYVMSQCPDAVLCEELWEDVLDKVSDLVQINTHYIATISGDAVSCKHGPNECMGNMQQLCAHHLFKQALGRGETDEYDDDLKRHPLVERDRLDANDWFEFVHCQSKRVREIPSEKLLDKCAKEVKSKSVTAKAIKQCVEKEGPALALASAQTVVARGATRSCTMYVANKLRCIHDGDWKECDRGHEVSDFVKDVCTDFAAINPGVALPKACRKVFE